MSAQRRAAAAAQQQAARLKLKETLKSMRHDARENKRRYNVLETRLNGLDSNIEAILQALRERSSSGPRSDGARDPVEDDKSYSMSERTNQTWMKMMPI